MFNKKKNLKSYIHLYLKYNIIEDKPIILKKFFKDKHVIISIKGPTIL